MYSVGSTMRSPTEASAGQHNTVMTAYVVLKEGWPSQRRRLIMLFLSSLSSLLCTSDAPSSRHSPLSSAIIQPGRPACCFVLLPLGWVPFSFFALFVWIVSFDVALCMIHNNFKIEYNTEHLCFRSVNVGEGCGTDLQTLRFNISSHDTNSVIV